VKVCNCVTGNTSTPVAHEACREAISESSTAKDQMARLNGTGERPIFLDHSGRSTQIAPTPHRFVSTRCRSGLLFAVQQKDDGTCNAWVAAFSSHLLGGSTGILEIERCRLDVKQWFGIKSRAKHNDSERKRLLVLSFYTRWTNALNSTQFWLITPLDVKIRQLAQLHMDKGVCS